MQIPRGRQLGRAARLEREDVALQQQRAGAELRAGEAAGAIAATTGDTLGRVALAEQEQENRANDLADASQMAIDFTRMESEVDALHEHIPPERLAEYRKGFEQHLSGLTRTDEQRENLRLAYAEGFAKLEARIAKKNRVLSQNQAATNLSVAADQAVDSRDAETLNMLADVAEGAGFFSPAFIAGLRGQATDVNNQNVVDDKLGALENVYTTLGLEQAYEKLETQLNDPTLSLAQQDLLRTQGKARIGQLRAVDNAIRIEQARELGELQSENYSDLSLRADFGYVTPGGATVYLTEEEVEAEYEAERISPEQRTELIGSIRRREAGQLEQLRVTEEIYQAIQTEMPLVGSKKHNDAATVLFDDFDWDRYGDATALERNTVLQFVRANAVPDQTKRLLASGMNTADPARRKSAVSLAMDLKQYAPNHYNETVSEADRRYYNAMESAVISNRPLDEAHTQYLDWQAKPESQRKQVLDQYRDVTDLEDNRAAFDSAVLDDPDLDPSMFSTPDVSNRLYGYFETLVFQNYRQHPNIDVARATAYQSLRKTLRPSGINGDTAIMAYPPEYIPGSQTPMPTGPIREQMDREVKELLGDKYSDKFEYRLVSDSLTMSRVTPLNGYPTRSYAILQIPKDEDDATGTLFITDKNNLPLRWEPDYAEIALLQEQAQSERRAEAQADVEIRQAMSQGAAPTTDAALEKQRAALIRNLGEADFEDRLDEMRAKEAAGLALEGTDAKIRDFLGDQWGMP